MDEGSKHEVERSAQEANMDGMQNIQVWIVCSLGTGSKSKCPGPVRAGHTDCRDASRDGRV